jgi:hypothetical protein
MNTHCNHLAEQSDIIVCVEIDPAVSWHCGLLIGLWSWWSPRVHTPTVALGCGAFSLMIRRPRVSSLT